MLAFSTLSRTGAALVATSLGSRAAAADAFDAGAFGALPVQIGGRVQPVDTLARNSLLLLRGKQSVAFSKTEALFWSKKPSAWSEAEKASFRAEGLPVDDKTVIDALEARPVAVAGGAISADVWLVETAFRPWISRHFRVFRIDHEEVQTLVGLKPGERNQFSWAEIEKGVEKLSDASRKAGEKESGARSPYERGVIKLAGAVERHHMLATVTFAPGDLPADIEPMREYGAWIGALHEAKEKLSAPKATGPSDKPDEATAKAMEVVTSLITRYRDFMQEGKVGIVPPRTDDELKDGKWANLGGALLDVTLGQPLDKPPVLLRYAELCESYRKGDDTASNVKVREIAALYSDGVGGMDSAKVSGELTFNRTQPFYVGLSLYAVAGLAVLGGWIAARRWLLSAAFWLIGAGWLIHTAGLVARMWIQGRPPVTNLYSSAVFVGWGAVLIGLIVERVWKNGVGSSVAAVVGFSTLVVAHQLGAAGDDSLEVMRAVLDSNFWLATHVVVITFGYSAMFVAGFLAAASLIRRVTDRSFDEKSAHAVSRSAYGALCFAALASFVGTMLGGIWADQSWGRFWGWDPKENGALLIVLWCALVLHARLGGLVKKTGFLQLLVVGNIVTAWSWFGTNMLGVGLHSYGFTDAAFAGLVGFVALQVIIIALGWLPERKKPIAI
jgi:ABC-type transport system involved in cytochrome c biogenesis permease subunit